MKSCGHGVCAYDGNSGFLNSNHDFILVFEIRNTWNTVHTPRTPTTARRVNSLPAGLLTCRTLNWCSWCFVGLKKFPASAVKWSLHVYGQWLDWRTFGILILGSYVIPGIWTNSFCISKRSDGILVHVCFGKGPTSFNRPINTVTIHFGKYKARVVRKIDFSILNRFDRCWSTPENTLRKRKLGFETRNKQLKAEEDSGNKPK